MVLRRITAVSPSPSSPSSGSTATPGWPAATPGDHIIKDFPFDSGESLPQLRIHYQTLGTLRVDAHGQATNAVLVLHGTGGSGDQFLRDIFAGELFNPGQPLDAQRYFIILRDGIGHGQSSKPSDGLRARFPKYGYRDMVRADHALLTAGLGVHHLRLVMGTSMGGMHAWLWAGTYPDFIDAAMPLASLPAQISGRNRMSRKMIIDGITLDPAYAGGEYPADQQPEFGLRSALYTLTWMKSAPLHWQKLAPNRDTADDFLSRSIADGLRTTDANDLLFQIASSADYDPRPLLHRITAPLLAVNSADDQVNPPELGILEAGVASVPGARAVVLPISPETRGHGTHTHARLWKHELVRLLAESGRREKL